MEYKAARLVVGAPPMAESLHFLGMVLVVALVVLPIALLAAHHGSFSMRFCPMALDAPPLAMSYL